MAELFWLTDRQWAIIKPLLLHLGGKPRVDDRRVISGILHRFREGPAIARTAGRIRRIHPASIAWRVWPGLVILAALV